MGVTREDVSSNSAILRVKVTPADYEKNVANAIEKTRKQANIPGFRKGHVPVSLVKKQYGKSILADELNKVVNDFLNSFITENKIEILGNPIPFEKEEVKGDFNNPTEFEFAFEIGITPEFKIDSTLKETFNYVSVKIDDELINKQVDDLRRRYGKLVASEKIGDTDLVMAQFTELNDDKSVKEGGIVHSSTISMEFVEDKKAKKELTGKKVGDKVVVNPAHVSKGGKDTAAILGIKEEDLATISDKFELSVTEVRHMELAELNQELFDKLFGEGEVKSESELKERVKADLDKMFANDSDRLLTRAVYDKLIADTQIDLPSDFLKRWIQVSNEKPITLEEIDAQFEGYEKGMKWQLIQGQIFKANDLKLNQTDAIEFTKELLANQYAQYGIPAPEDKELTASAIQVLGNREESARVYDMLAESKLTEFFKANVKLKNKEVSYDEFVEIASK
ncbi:MAG: trigger factor [Crocinitomicaceae bacterium]|jgi:trigger factor